MIAKKISKFLIDTKFKLDETMFLKIRIAMKS